ncbi:Rap1 - C-terminal [Penicillium concentricum]|uniref:DNA-binding protein RAP1 n=1 Tax=Penicillium concentricum TaxID=293559 RepID=A0A9W9SS53_9EURO|nr:Rap1 - C-terminal [Penicillium concentricum]KAJ5383718.1 Rap1 - C-terminal [Penicillium concentricum]
MATNINDSSRAETTTTSLFKGARFWLSRTVPQRSRFKELIKQYGGTVVLMEKDADVKLVDHTRKDLPGDTFSYQYVERSINKGRLEDLEAHRVGPSAPRPMGAFNIPTKSTRSFFTLKEDQIVFDWVAHFEQEPGAPVQGNRIYQDLSELFPAHPWQSWRSRYMKHLRGKGRPGGGSPVPYSELVQSAQPQGERPKTLPARSSPKGSTEKPSTAKPSSRVPQLPPPARVQASTANSPKRKRDPVPEPPNQRRRDVSPMKRRAIESSTIAGPSSRRPRSGSRGPQIESSNMAATPPFTARPERRSPGVSSSETGPLQGLGIPGLFPVTNPSTQTSRRVTRETPQRPPNAAESPAPPAPPRPLGDNAFAQSNRFKKQAPNARPPVKNIFEDPVDPIFLELPFLPSSPPSEVVDDDDDTSDAPDVDTWIDQRLARGAKESHVFEALRCTSMVPEMADKVLKYLTAGKVIPDDMPGVWTAEDDDCLQAAEHSRVQRALTKHGAEAYKDRWEYFSMARQTGLIE